MANVNMPTNTAIKERDINQKLQLYGIFTAFSNGKVPSNKQIDVAMNSALESPALAKPSPKLSEEGRALIGDVRDVIKQAQHLLLSKNEGNLLQDFLWQCQNLDGGNAGLPGAPVDKNTAKQHGNQALDGLKTLGTLIITNGQFRKLLNDATVLLRDMAGDAASSAANKINPSEDQLNQIDQPAEDNTWHDTPDVGGMRQQARDQLNKNKPFSRGDVKAAGQDAANTAQNEPTADNQDAANVGASRMADNLQNQASDNIPDETKDKARETKDRAREVKDNTVQSSKNYLSNKMPQERRDQTIWRLKKMVVEIQGHSDYQQAIETLLGLAETYGGHANNVAGQSKGTVKGAHADDSLRTAEANLKTLIERFANSTSTDDLFESLNNIYRDADRDPELKNWFKTLDRYIRRCLQEQGYILKDESTEEWNRIYDKGHFLLRERYRNHTDRILDETKFLADQFDQDPQNRAFANSMNKLFQDLGNDENGKPAFKPHLIKDLVNVIIPTIFENTRYVPIPRIEVSDPMIDAIVENLVIESDNLFPNMLEFGNDNYFRLGRRQFNSKNEHKVMIAASGIQCDLRDVAYYVKKKQGFPSITDKGVMDIMLQGDGFSFKLAARTANNKDRTHFVSVDNVTVQVKNLAIKIKQSNHKLLFNIAKPILLKVMRPVIQKVIEKQIKNTFEQMDAYAWDIFQDVQEKAKVAANNPDQAQNIYQQYVNAIQRKVTANKEKAKEKSANTNVNVAVTKQDSMFPNISLPGGISTKATEYKDLAAKGDRWESPVFGIGGARESSNIPRLTQVTRKPHSTATGTIRGGNHPHADAGNTNRDAFSSNTGSQGYGNTASQGYGNTGSQGYNNTGSQGYNNNTGTQGFSSQVDSAFGSNPSGNLGINGTKNADTMSTSLNQGSNTGAYDSGTTGATGTTGTTGTSPHYYEGVTTAQ